MHGDAQPHRAGGEAGAGDAEFPARLRRHGDMAVPEPVIAPGPGRPAAARRQPLAEPGRGMEVEQAALRALEKQVDAGGAGAG